MTAIGSYRSWGASALSLGASLIQGARTVGGYLVPRTVFYYTNEQIERDRTSQISLSMLEKGWVGVTTGLKAWLPLVLTSSCLINPAVKHIWQTLGAPIEEATFHFCELGFLRVGVTAPIQEEMLFRYIIQNNLISFAQQLMELCIAASFTDRIANWMTSPQARIFAVNALFAAWHLQNIGGYLSSHETVSQVIRLTLLSQYAGIYETTGSLAAPIAMHMTTNALSYLVSCVAGPIFTD